MVGNDADGNVRLFVFGGRLVGYFGRSRAVIFYAYLLGNKLNKRLKHVGVVVGLHARHGHHQALEAHAGIDVLGGQLHQAFVGEALEFHEHIVPHFHHLRVVGVDQLPARFGGYFGLVAQIDMNFGARPARTRVAHFPEVIFLISGQNPVVGSVLTPQVLRLGIGGELVAGVALEIRDVETVFGQLIHVGKQLPGPGNGVFFEIITERPVTEHLEHGVVVGVVAYLLQVVVLARHAQALLGVGNALEGRGLVAEEVVLERGHARVDEQQRGVVLDHNRGRGHDVVAFRSKEVQELLADVGGGRE